MTLDTIRIGQKSRVIAVDWSRLVEEEALRLQALGIEEGARITVTHRGIFGGGDPIALEIGRMTIALRRKHAAAITVEPA